MLRDQDYIYNYKNVAFGTHRENPIYIFKETLTGLGICLIAVLPRVR